MENLNVFAKQLNEEKPPPRVCPRCKSDNTKFCYYNNYSVSQPRYFCKNCRRYWTHGGALRNIPIGGSCRKPKRPKVDQPSVRVEIQPVNHQPFRHVQTNNEFVGSFGVSSPSSTIVEFGSLHEIHSVTNVSPIRSFRPMDRLDVPGESFQQEYYDVGSNDLVPFINQSIGGYVDDPDGYRINQVDQLKWHQSLNNTMNMNHKASTSGSRGSSGAEMNKNNNKIRNNCLFRSS